MLAALALLLPALAADPAVPVPPAPAQEAPVSVLTDEAYAREIDLIRRLYLRPKDVEAGALLRSAAVGLADDLDWLVVEPDGDTVYLRHGDGTPIGSVSVASIDTLPAALRSLESVVLDAGQPLGDTDVRLEICKGVTLALDKHSRVLAGEKLDRFDVRLKGTLVGIGATLERGDGNHLVITAIAPGGPAEHAGMKVGDVLLRIDGASTTNMQVKDATERIRGEVDTEITVGIERIVDGKAKNFDLTLTRAEVVVPNVTSKVLAGNIGYVRIDHFSQKTVDNLVAELDRLRAANALGTGLVLDLRGNTGGSMKEAARAADQFVTSGMLLRTEGPDGGKVANLQPRMDAVDAGNEPAIPIVILVDPQTASGSEILAGALVELDRAILVGRTTYGKGTVQKIYNLDDDVRLKLTVAEYVLENDHHITRGGLVPDVAVGLVELDGSEVRYTGWTDAGSTWDQILPIVAERDGERLVPDPDDAEIELARRIAVAAGPGVVTRDDTLSAMTDVLPAFRAEQENRLVAAMEQRNIDWNAATVHVPEPPRAKVTIASAPDPSDSRRVIVTASVESEEPLSRALVELECDGYDAWNGLVVPIGAVTAGSRAQGRVSVELPPGVEPREDLVHVTLHADQHGPLIARDGLLRASSLPIPRLEVTAKLVDTTDGKAVQLDISNPSNTALDDLEVRFSYPDDDTVELIDGEQKIAAIPAHGNGRAVLHLALGEGAPALIPLELVIDAEGFSRIVDWTLQLPADGAALALEAPRVTFKAAPLSSSAGPVPFIVQVADERGLAHVQVWANGDKIAWTGGAKARVELRPTIEVKAGLNWIRVVAEDDQGVITRKTIVIRGEEAQASVDAGTGEQ